MRLLTHNYLQSNVKGTERGYPLIIQPTEIIVDDDVPVDTELLLRILPKIDYTALYTTFQQLQQYCKEENEVNDNKSTNDIILAMSIPPTLPLPSDLLNDMDEITTTNLFRVLFTIHIQQGILICPDTSREFTIKDGIPNMILHEDEL